MDINETIIDLIAEQQALDEVVEKLDTHMWTVPTSSDRWNVADQIGHLTYFDNAASLAITNPSRSNENGASCESSLRRNRSRNFG